jgi:hypothetical protein
MSKEQCYEKECLKEGSQDMIVIRKGELRIKVYRCSALRKIVYTGTVRFFKKVFCELCKLKRERHDIRMGLKRHCFFMGLS